MARRAPRGEIARSATLTLRLTPEERAEIEQRAAAAGLTPSAYAAKLVSGAPVVVEKRETMDPALFIELSRIGNNVNQLAHAANAGYPPQAQQLLDLMDGLFRTLMRDELTRRRAATFARERRPGDGAEAP